MNQSFKEMTQFTFRTHSNRREMLLDDFIYGQWTLSTGQSMANLFSEYRLVEGFRIIIMDFDYK